MNQLQSIPVSSVVSAGNIRDDIGDVTELAASIAEVGLLEPLVVQPDHDRYQLLAGHRRLAAVQQLGWTEVPAVIRPVESDGLDDASRIVIQLVENLQRRDLDPFEEARGLAQLKALGWKQADIAKRIGRSPGHVSKRLALLDLPDELTEHIDGLTTDSLTKIASAARAGADLGQLAATIQANGGRMSSALVDSYTERAMKRLEAEKEIERRTADYEANGIKVLPVKGTNAWGDPELPKDRIGYGGFLGNLVVDDHAKEPCHAVCLYIRWDSHVYESYHCTDRRRHEPGGASKLKVEEDRSKASKKSPEEVQRKRRLALVSTGLTKAVEASAAHPPAKDQVLWAIAEWAFGLMAHDFGLDVELYRDITGVEDVTVEDFRAAGDTKTRVRLLWSMFLTHLRSQVDDWEIRRLVDDGEGLLNFSVLVDVLTEAGYPPSFEEGAEA